MEPGPFSPRTYPFQLPEANPMPRHRLPRFYSDPGCPKPKMAGICWDSNLICGCWSHYIQIWLMHLEKCANGCRCCNIAILIHIGHSVAWSKKRAWGRNGWAILFLDVQTAHFMDGKEVSLPNRAGFSGSSGFVSGWHIGNLVKPAFLGWTWVSIVGLGFQSPFC